MGSDPPARWLARCTWYCLKLLAAVQRAMNPAMDGMIIPGRIVRVTRQWLRSRRSHGFAQMCNFSDSVI